MSKAKAPLISIVDDDALARDGIRELVESLGYNAITFSSAEYFLQSDAIAETTCLITDLQMPGLNGLQLQEALRSRGYQTPVILITAYQNEKDRARALDNGAIGFLSKPFDEGSLIECLTVAIRLQSSQLWRHGMTLAERRQASRLPSAIAIISAVALSEGHPDPAPALELLHCARPLLAQMLPLAVDRRRLQH